MKQFALLLITTLLAGFSSTAAENAGRPNIIATHADSLVPPSWDPALAGDEVMRRLNRVTAPHVKGAHDAEFVCVGDRAYIVEHDNDVQPGHGAGAAQYCVLSAVNLKTFAVERV